MNAMGSTGALNSVLYGVNWDSGHWPWLFNDESTVNKIQWFIEVSGLHLCIITHFYVHISTHLFTHDRCPSWPNVMSRLTQILGQLGHFFTHLNAQISNYERVRGLVLECLITKRLHTSSHIMKFWLWLYTVSTLIHYFLFNSMLSHKFATIQRR